MSDYVEDELELGDYVAILKRRWIWFITPLVLFPLLALYFSSAQTDRFSASSQVLLSDSAAQEAVGGGSQSTAFRDRILENEISLARSDQALTEMATRLSLGSTDDIPDFSVTADSSSDVLLFAASSETADGAAAVANVAAESYVFLKQEQAQASIQAAVVNLESTLDSLQDERDLIREDLIVLEDRLAAASDENRAAAQTLVDRESSRISGQVQLVDAQIAATADSITQLELSGELAAGGTARIVAVAVPPVSSSNAPASRNIALGLVVGAILGAAAALLRENLDDKVRDAEDFEQLGLVPLGSIPRAGRKANDMLNLARIAHTDAETPQAQAHQKTQAAVRFLASQHGISNVLVTSASQGEGKTTLASNLAISMARSNVRTVLVDLDLRRPRIHRAYDLKQSPGITTVAVDGIDVVNASTLVEGLEDRLAVVPAGKLPPHPASFISSNGFVETVKELSKLADFTVFDAPPILPVADTLSLAQLVDGVIVVAYAASTKREDLRDALESLHSSGANVLGAVLLGAKEDPSGYNYYATGEELERM